MDASMKRALKEYVNHGGSMKTEGSWGRRSSTELSRARRQLGPRAAHLLSSSTTALEAYRAAPRDVVRTGGAATQQLSEEEQPSGLGQQSEASNFFSGAGSQGQQQQWSSSWHPGREQEARGSGESLLRSRRTQEAMRELRSHQASKWAAVAPMHLELKQEEPGQRPGSHELLATKLAPHAGFTKVHDRGQALEAIKDLLTERLGSVGQMSEAHTESLSMAHGLKVERARLEGLVHNIGRTEADMADIKAAQRGKRASASDQSLGEARGRTIGEGYKSVEDKLEALKRAIAGKEDAIRHDEIEVRRVQSRVNVEHKAALVAGRSEMARYGRADTARRSAEAYAHKLLAEKARAKLLEGQERHEQARAKEYQDEGEKLKAQSKREESQFESMAGPVRKAQEEVKVANSAYNAAEMKLAQEETLVQSMGMRPNAHPKQLKAAMGKIEKDRKLAMSMEHLVGESTRRMEELSNRNGPLTGLDSHFEGPKERAVRKLGEARRIREKMASIKQVVRLLSPLLPPPPGCCNARAEVSS